MGKRIIRAAVLYALLLAGCCAVAWGGQMPLICANYTSTPPSIDGQMGPAWAGAPAYDSFVLFNGGKPSALTTLRLLYDEKNLYILYRCAEPKMKDLKTQPRQHNGAVWSDDSADFFLIPVTGSTTPTGYHFIANASGSTYNEKISYPRNIDTAWDAPWKAAASTDPEGWTLSMAIPWSTLGLAGAPAGSIEGNFGRVRKPVPENSALYPSGGFQNINNKVVIKLAKAAPGVQGLSWSQNEKNGTLTAGFSLQNPSKSDNAELEVRSDGDRLAAKNVNMIGGKAVSVEMSMPAPDDPEGCPVQLIVKARGGKDIYFASAPFVATGARKELALDIKQLYYYPGEAPVVKVNSRIAGKLELKVVRNGSANIVSRKMVALKPGAAEIKLNGRDIKGEGNYTVVGTVAVSGSAKKASTGFGIVPPAKWPRVDVKNVSLGAEGTILVNGSPYFPVDMYHAEVEDYPDMAYLGFNTVGSGWNTLDVLLKELDAARANGILCNLGLPDRGYGDRLAKRETYKAKVDVIKNHPALLFYHLVDEPAVSFYPTFEKGYRYIKELDGVHLQYCTLPNFMGYPDSIIDAAGRTRDIYAPDIYPFDCYPVTAVSDAMRICVAAAKRADWSKSVIYVGPCFEWLPTYRMPKPDELRLVTYLSVINGTKGISWYSYREPGLEKAGVGYGLHMPRAAKIRSCFKRLNSELARLYPAICAPTPAQAFQAKSAEGMEFILKEGKDAWYIIAANTGKKVNNVTFSQKEKMIPDGRVEVFSEYRSLKMAGGTFTDSFGPEAVHIYVIQKGEKTK
jgi:hypothetical protein